MTATVPLTLRRMQPEDHSGVLALLTDALGDGPTGQRSPAFFAWKHLHSPFGPSPGILAESEGRVLGVRLGMRWEFRIGSRQLRAARMVDTATHIDARGLGIFRNLTLRFLDEFADELDLAFNTPNDQSRPGYLKMGWQPVAELPISVRVMRPLRFLRAARRSRHGSDPSNLAIRCPFSPAREVLAVGATRDFLTELAAGAYDERLATLRTPEYLQWRYAEPPDLDYRAIVVEDGGQLAGIAIGRARARGALAEFTLSEVLCRPGDRRTARRLLRAAAKAGTDHVSTYVQPRSSVRAAARRAGYLPLPGARMTLVANPRRELPVNVLEPSSWALSLGDLEVF